MSPKRDPQPPKKAISKGKSLPKFVYKKKESKETSVKNAGVAVPAVALQTPSPVSRVSPQVVHECAIEYNSEKKKGDGMEGDGMEGDDMEGCERCE